MRWLHASVLVILVCISPLYAQFPALRVGWPRVANTFFTDEAPKLVVTASGPSSKLNWYVSDFDGRFIRSGWCSSGKDVALTLSLGQKLPPGFYHLKLVHPYETWQDDFCVIPRPYEDPGDYNLFGLHPNNGSTDENLAPAAQMGVRLIRQTIPWPPFEPSRGQYRMDLLDDWYSLGRRYGMQMMMVLGYTPSWLAEAPVNISNDWVRVAAFTWHMREPNAFALYLDQVMGYSRDKTISWPPSQCVSAQSPISQQRLPWAQSWEMWNEADIMFYMGDWNRYMDMLRLAWAAGRGYTPQVPMIYGGSTGNFPAMCMVASGATRYNFDYLSLHPAGDIEEALRVWYSGAQQIPWCVGAPRETMHTECYAQGRRNSADFSTYRETPGELMRCYLTLKAWREAAFYRSGCLGGYIQEPGCESPGTAMLIPRRGGFSPTPLYPAFAAARKLLSDATEVGPVKVGDKVTAHVFLKHGKLLLAAWSDDKATARIVLAPVAFQINYFGQQFNLPGGRILSRKLGREPLIILGAEPSKYLREALLNRFRLLTATVYGTVQVNKACGIWYAKPLSVDLEDMLGTDAPLRLTKVMQQAARTASATPKQGPACLAQVQQVCLQLMQRIVAECPQGQELPKRSANDLWRLARLSEWLGEIADDRSGLWGNFEASPANVVALTARIHNARSRITTAGDGNLPVAEQLLDRAARQELRLAEAPRQGTYLAMLHKVIIAEALMGVEKPVVLRVVPLVDFSTSRCFRKTRLLEPGTTQTLNVWVYNWLDHTVSGTLTLKLPQRWQADRLTVPFEAQAGQPSAMIPVTVNIPSDPTPWRKVESITLDGLLNVTLPPQLEDRPMLEVGGNLSTGEELSSMAYFVNVGRWADEPSQAAAAAPSNMVRTQEQYIAREIQTLANW